MKRLNITITILLIIFIGALATLAIHNKSTSQSKEKILSTTPKIGNDYYQKLTWESGTTTANWGARDAHVVTAFKNKLWLIGGLEGNDAVSENGMVRYWDAPHMSDIWSSSDGLLWDLVTDKAPWKNRRSVSAVSFKDKLWVMGGWDQYNYKYTNDIWVSDNGTDWNIATSTSPRWEGREGQIVLEFNDRLWFMGGVNFTKRITYNDVWSSSDGYTWVKATSTVPWSPRYDHAVSVFDDTMYLTGGLHINTHDTEAEVWVTKDGINWEKRVPEWPSRHGHISLVHKDRLWVIGGWHQNDGTKENMGINDTWFTDDGIKWYKTNTDGPWTGREDHMGEVFKDKMWISGGMDNDEKWSNEIYFSAFPTVQ